MSPVMNNPSHNYSQYPYYFPNVLVFPHELVSVRHTLLTRAGFLGHDLKWTPFNGLSQRLNHLLMMLVFIGPQSKVMEAECCIGHIRPCCSNLLRC